MGSAGIWEFSTALILMLRETENAVLSECYYYYYYYMALQPISGLGLLFMRFRNLTLIDNW
jgi:hypothetical protein